MLVLVSEIPEYCPKCGNTLKIENRGLFTEGESTICKCGCGIQRIEIDIILEVAEEEGGDLQYMDLSLDMSCNSEDLDSLF